MRETVGGRQLIGQRIVTRAGGSIQGDVVVRLGEPEFAPEHERGEYRSTFEIVGLDDPVRGDAYGIDGLQALVAAKTQTVYALWPFRSQLEWLGDSYDWSIADCVQIADGGRRRRLRAIIDEQQFASEQQARDRELLRRAALARTSSPGTAQRASTTRPSARLDDDIEDAIQHEPVCTRRLTYNARSEVRISIWRPTPIGGLADNYRCAFAVAGLGDGAPRLAGGVDTMQALVQAMVGAKSILAPYEAGLTWFTLPYDDPALFPHVLDAGRLRRIHAIIDEELDAIDELRRSRARLRSEGGLRRRPD